MARQAGSSNDATYPFRIARLPADKPLEPDLASQPCILLGSFVALMLTSSQDSNNDATCSGSSSVASQTASGSMSSMSTSGLPSQVTQLTSVDTNLIVCFAQ